MSMIVYVHLALVSLASRIKLAGMLKNHWLKFTHPLMATDGNQIAIWIHGNYKPFLCYFVSSLEINPRSVIIMCGSEKVLQRYILTRKETVLVSVGRMASKKKPPFISSRPYGTSPTSPSIIFGMSWRFQNSGWRSRCQNLDTTDTTLVHSYIHLMPMRDGRHS